jgi:hypothetical protein
MLGTRQLAAYGFVVVEFGKRRVGKFTLSNRWRTIDMDAAARLKPQARLPGPSRRKPVATKSVKSVRHVLVEPPRRVPRPTPSLPVLRCLQDDLG